MSKVRETQVIIDYHILRKNYRILLENKASSQPIYIVVKANAYGHGLLGTVQALYDEGCRYFATYHLKEAMFIKSTFLEVNVLTLGPFHKDYFQAALENQIEISISSINYLQEIIPLLESPTHIHIKVETGMNRLGIQWADRQNLLIILKSLASTTEISIFSHLSAGTFGDDLDRVQAQINKFDEWLNFMNSHHISFRSIHLNNSVNFPSNKKYGARLGIGLYGYPEQHLRKSYPYVDKLQSAMTVRTRLMDVKMINADSYIGYGLHYKTLRDSIIGYIPVGYSDGYHRMLSNKSRVLLKNGYAPVVGVINMNLMAIDLTELAEKWNSISEMIDEEVILIGTNDYGSISAYELAALTNTIPYEILTQLGNQARRLY